MAQLPAAASAGSPLFQRLPSLASTGLVIVIAWVLADWTWKLVPVTQPDAPATVAGPSAPGRTPAARPVVRDLAGMQLFGEAAPQTGSAKRATAAPQTRLKLLLHGVAVTDTGGVAIIEQKGGKQAYFRVGGDVFGMARLTEIHADHVVLDRQGRQEVLVLHDEAAQRLERKAQRAAAKPGPVRQAHRAGEYRDGIVSGKNRNYSKEIGFRTNYRNGAPYGFVLQAKNPDMRDLMEEVGLEDNDIVVELDGVELNGSLQAMEALKSLRTATRVTVGIERDGEFFSTQFQLTP